MSMGVGEPTPSGPFELPPTFPGGGHWQAIPAPSGRTFGTFEEKTLRCDAEARSAIDKICWAGGFTQAWEAESEPHTHTMTKIPVIILVKLMLGLPADATAAVDSLKGAYAICMSPHERTCMNVIVGRRSDGASGFALDKFSLYYPDNAAASSTWGQRWPLVQGYSFRTAALSGSLNRVGLDELRRGSVPTAPGTSFDRTEYGLVIDDTSAFEDCAYVETRAGESDEARVARIEGMVKGMVVAYGGQSGILALSYDSAERAQGITALESEWTLLKKLL